MVDGQNVLDPNTLVNGRMSEDEDEDKLSAKMIPTITIPSSPIPPADQGPDSPRKSAKEKPKEPTRQPISAPKPKPLPTSKPAAPKDKAPGADTPSGSAKGKRLPVAKKTKKGSDRKRKGKSSEMEEAQPAPAASGDASGEVAVDQ
nr:hypothetical protein BaRGS_023684 [Batillaria attramentaria]